MPPEADNPDFISTHALREEGDRERRLWRKPGGISTHALREEGDCIIFHFSCKQFVFLPTPSARRATWCGPSRYPRDQFLPTPSARRATILTKYLFLWYNKFLPTPSARRATRTGSGQDYPCTYFYPRPPRGGRLLGAVPVLFELDISTHALREEGDAGQSNYKSAYKANFYPRPPRGGRPPYNVCCAMSALFLPTPSARRATWP